MTTQLIAPDYSDSLIIFSRKIRNESRRRQITPELVCEIVAGYFGEDAIIMRGSSRRRELSLGRFICYGILRKYTRISLKNIGEYFNRDHTSVIHGLDTLNDLMGIYERVRDDFRAIEKLVLL